MTSEQTKTADRLLPCPFCGGVDIRLVRHPGSGVGINHQGDDIYSIDCIECGATFPNRYRPALLCDAWNTRAAAPKASPADPAQQATKGECILCHGTGKHYQAMAILPGQPECAARLVDCHQCAAPLAAQQAPVQPAGSDEPRHLLIAKIRALVIGVAEQQAMPDDWWKPHLANIIASLAPQPAAPAQPPAKVEREGLTEAQIDAVADATALLASKDAEIERLRADARRLDYMAQPGALRMIEEESGLYRVYQDLAEPACEHHRWCAMTMAWHASARDAIDAALAAQAKGGEHG